MNFPLALIVIVLAAAGFVAVMARNVGGTSKAPPKPKDAPEPPPIRELREKFGARMIQSSVHNTRPRFAASVDDVKKLPLNECGVFEGLLVPDEPRFRFLKDVELYSTLEHGKIRIGPVRSGKSLDTKEEAIEWIGPLVSASTKLDILTDTYKFRPGGVFIFNPEGQWWEGETLTSNLRWNPVFGCKDVAVASRRARHLVIGTTSVASGADKAFWAEKAHVVLAAFMYVADHLDGSLLMVKQWANDWADETPFEWLAVNASEENVQLRNDLAQIRKHTDRMRDSIFATLAQMLNCLREPGVQEVIAPKAGERLFDPGRFVQSKASLYLIAENNDFGGIGAIFASIVGEIYDVAKMTARRSKKGRLDPPLLLSLDEAPSICPVALDKWAIEAGGQGIRLSVCIQDRSQLYDTWGDNGGKAIYNNLLKHIFPGVHDDDLLAELSRAAGKKTVLRSSATISSDGSRSVSYNWDTDVLRFATNDITEMNDGESLFYYANKKVVKVRHPYGRAAAKVEMRKDQLALPRPRPPTRGGTPMVAAGETTTAAIVRIHPELADDEEVGESSG